VKNTQRSDDGFSTIELLISLFIAAAFIATGFQLFTVVIQDGNEARLRSRASNVAHENLRKYAGSVTTVCSSRPSTATPAAPSDLPQASITVAFSCPYGDDSKTTRIEATVTYGTPQQTVKENLDVSK
jgi:type II secretory pathway pseudopilin PulG